MPLPLLGLTAGVWAGLRKFFFNKKGIFALLGIIGVNLMTWGFLATLTDTIAQSLTVSTFPQGTFGYHAINFVLLCGLNDYAAIVLGALAIKLTLQSLKLRIVPGSQMSLF